MAFATTVASYQLGLIGTPNKDYGRASSCRGQLVDILRKKEFMNVGRGAGRGHRNGSKGLEESIVE